MEPEAVTALAQTEIGENFTLIAARSHGAMMQANLFGESLNAPAFATRRQHGDNIDSASFQRHISTDLFKTGAPKELASARNMLRTGKTVVVCLAALAKGCSNQAELRIRRQALQKKSKVLGIKRDIGIE